MDATPASRRVRVGDAEREAVVEQLRAAVGAGRLDLEEFDRRATRAFAAETDAELAAATAGLAPRPGPYPPRMAPAGGPVIARFGTIAVTGTAVRTPAGEFPLAGTAWHTYDHWYTTRVLPSWAIALAVLGFFVVPFVSLLFLLVREPRTTGVLQVVVSDGLRQYVADVPVSSPAAARAVQHQVGYVRALANA